MWMTALTRLRARALCHPGPAWHAHRREKVGLVPLGPAGGASARQSLPAATSLALAGFTIPRERSLNWAPDAGGAGKAEPGLTLTHLSCADIFLGGARPNLAEKGVEATGERGPA